GATEAASRGRGDRDDLIRRAERPPRDRAAQADTRGEVEQDHWEEPPQELEQALHVRRLNLLNLGRVGWARQKLRTSREREQVRREVARRVDLVVCREHLGQRRSAAA